MLDELFTPDHWRKRRQENLNAARATRDFLINEKGHSPDEDYVKDAVAFWVRRARRCHAIALGREPLMPKVVAIQGGEMTTGPVYAGEAV